ncbi:DUF5085 family protein [Staphylococcus argensis]|uniref:DUF5085 domain-containing protein n=1 Tax=Staphylococcus argensis TaxID=1607738 RepID=A0A2K4FC12_9STAP|nr:DUF5085 family protein [Staphylococcus argensis]MCY6992052.1 DUF5085 family protein [Staphylococcus argensis]POA08894.1 hypothetical protein CD039_07850 [Staphylococcus argensis]
MNEYGLSEIRLKNVVYRSYIDIPISQIEEYVEKFVEACYEEDVQIDNRLIMAITQLTLDRHINVTFYAPINRAILPSSELNFRSYLIIEDMIQGRIRSKQFELEEQQLIDEFNDFRKEYDYQIVSPYYHIFHLENNKAWIDVKAKVMELE